MVEKRREFATVRLKPRLFKAGRALRGAEAPLFHVSAGILDSANIFDSAWSSDFAGLVDSGSGFGFVTPIMGSEFYGDGFAVGVGGLE